MRIQRTVDAFSYLLEIVELRVIRNSVIILPSLRRSFRSVGIRLRSLLDMCAAFKISMTGAY